MKKILFVIDSLHCAGAEKSLTTLLYLLDYSKYDVDLQLFSYGGALEELVPKEVNILKPMEYIKFSSISIKAAFIKSLRSRNFKMFNSRLRFSLAIRKKKCSNVEKARLYWKSVSSVIEMNNKEYDIAISYAQGVPTFYVAEKVCAKKKFAWVNVSYKLGGEDKIFQEKFYDKYNRIVAVSECAKNVFLETFPNYRDKIEIIYDINDGDFIKKMSEQGESYTDDYDGIRVLTIGRLATQKGYDIALEACKILKERGVKFKWYSLGIGPLKEEIEKYIIQNNLENYFELLGVKSNPYPFIKDCDIYVQTSRFEGFGIAIAEARMLNKPVVTTRFDAVYNQMIDRKNGLVVDMNAKSVAEGILELINNKELSEQIINFLYSERKGNIEEINKFNLLINK